MKKLDEYLDCDIIKVKTKDDNEYIGAPIVVNYSDETESGENELTIEGNKIWGFIESEIESIEIMDKIER